MPTRDPQRRPDASTPAGRAAGSGATWLGLIAAFAMGAGTGWLGGHVTSSTGAAASASAEPAADDGQTGAALTDRMVALDPFIVNLLGEDASRYLKVRIALEAETPALRTELAERTSHVRDGILSVLSSHDVVDVTSVEGKTLLKHDILERVNALLRGGRVRSVLFTEFVVQ